MYKFNDIRVNDILKESESYSFSRNEKEPKDSKDKLVRAFLIDVDLLKSIKKNPNEAVIFDKNKEVRLEIGNYLTSNGKLIKKETFEKVYRISSEFTKNFLQERSKATENILDILERFHGKKQNPKIKNPRI
jgi:hypothetical protein